MAPKKKITGKSKLATTAETDLVRESLDLVRHRKKTTMKAYRFHDNDLVRLKKITQELNKRSNRHISETQAVRALIALGVKTKPDRLFKILRENW